MSEHTKRDSEICCSLIGQRNTKVFCAQSGARTGWTVRNYAGETLSPGAPCFALVLPVPTFPRPAICPWVSDDGAQVIQNSITSYHKNQERTRKKREREKKNNNRSHDWKKNAPKPCELLQRFFAKLNELSMKLFRNELPRIFFLKSLPCYWL